MPPVAGVTKGGTSSISPGLVIGRCVSVSVSVEDGYTSFRERVGGRQSETCLSLSLLWSVGNLWDLGCARGLKIWIFRLYLGALLGRIRLN